MVQGQIGYHELSRKGLCQSLSSLKFKATKYGNDNMYPYQLLLIEKLILPSLLLRLNLRDLLRLLSQKKYA